jgi:transcriptional regulator with XRE-family HTH domain
VPSRKNIAIRFGVRLRTLRQQAGLTQEQLAEAAEVSINFVSLVERGLKSPTLATMERFANALKVPLLELFRFDN